MTPLEKPEIDLARLRAGRLERLRAALRRADVPLAILVNPVSLRYAVDHRVYASFQARIPTYTLLVPAEGPVVMHGAYEESAGLIDEFRPALGLNTFDGGFDLTEQGRRLAGEVKEFLRGIGIGDAFPRVAAERLNPSTTQALLQAGLEVQDADGLLERTRAVKLPEELDCMRHAITVAEHALRTMQDALEPGISENQLWSILHQVNIAHDGEWIDGRMLSAGARSNPWFQEASDKIIQAGELVALDSDMIGPFGYCADISRTWLCGPAVPKDRQRDVYRQAYDEVHHNIELIRPGLSFRELTARAFRPREEFVARRYPCLAHGVGLTDEYPKIHYRQDWDEGGYDGMLEPNMVLSVESYTGSDRGGEGAKLEQMVLVTETGCETLSNYPFEAELL